MTGFHDLARHLGERVRSATIGPGVDALVRADPDEEALPCRVVPQGIVEEISEDGQSRMRSDVVAIHVGIDDHAWGTGAEVEITGGEWCGLWLVERELERTAAGLVLSCRRASNGD